MEGNVQILLKAERDANVTIERALENKAQKKKEAMFHANQEIEKFRQAEEQHYKDEIEKTWGARNDLEELEKETKIEIEAITREFEANKSKVIDLLLENVMTVNLEIPDVVKGVFEQIQSIISNS